MRALAPRGGGNLRTALEQGISLKAGMVQVSGIKARYADSRLLSVGVRGTPLDDEKTYRVTTNSFMAEGGNGYASLTRGKRVQEDPLISEVLTDHIRKAKLIRS